MHGRYPIGPHQVHGGVGDNACHPETSGTDVDDEIDVPREDRALGVDGQPCPVQLVPGLGAGQQVFLAVLDPDHALLGVFRQHGEHDLLAVHIGLGAEPATHVRHADHDVLAVPVGHRADRVAHHVRHLGRGVHLDASASGVVIGEHAATFQRHRTVALHPVGALHDVGGCLESLIGSAELVLQTSGLVVRQMTEQRGAVRIERGGSIGQHRQHLVGHDDALGCVLGDVAVAGDDHGDRLADVVHTVDGEDGEALLSQLQRRGGSEVGVGRGQRRDPRSVEA